jgi:two-component system, NarL family, sensor kinase
VSGSGSLWLAGVRLALVPVVLIGEQLVDHPAEPGAGFAPLLGAFAVWALALLALHLRQRAPVALQRAEPFVDLLAIAALSYASGGPFSATGMAFFVLPLLTAVRLRPAITARWAVAAVCAYAALSILHPTAGEPEATARMLSQLAYLGWAGVAATLVSSLIDRRDATIARLATEGEQLAAHALTAEQRERRRVAELLHDESVQTLALAQQELGDYRRTGREAAYERARSAIAQAIAQLRGEIFELHPYVLDHLGLSAALEAIADRAAGRIDAQITVAVDPAASGLHDELLVVLARELLANAVKHSEASRVVLTVAVDAERVELEVRDDGVGLDPARPAAALREGHIGLAAAERRVKAAGGELTVDSSPGRGATVRAALPRGHGYAKEMWAVTAWRPWASVPSASTSPRTEQPALGRSSICRER